MALHHNQAGLDVSEIAELAERVPVGLFQMDTDTMTVRWANHMAAALAGITPEEAVGTSVLDWIHPEDLELATVSFMVAMQHPDAIQPVSYRIMRKDGGVTFADVIGSWNVHKGSESLTYTAVIPVGHRVALENIYGEIGAEQSFDRVLDLLVDAMSDALIATSLVAVFDGDDGERVVKGADLPDVLWRFLDDQDMADADMATISDLSVLPPAVRSAASHAGFTCFAYHRVTDPRSDRPAWLVGWTTDTVLADRFRVRTDRMFANVMALALQRRAMTSALEHAARHDALTGIANRLAFMQELDRLDADGTSARAVLFVDLDGFKSVNDEYGHSVGDQFLRELSGRIAHAVREHDFVARIGGDEFAIICSAVDTDADVRALASRILDAFAQPVRVGGNTIARGASVGVAFDEAGTTTGTRLLEAADAAMYAAKRSGKGRFTLTTTD